MKYFIFLGIVLISGMAKATIDFGPPDMSCNSPKIDGTLGIESERSTQFDVYLRSDDGKIYRLTQSYYNIRPLVLNQNLRPGDRIEVCGNQGANLAGYQSLDVKILVPIK